jgi:hypothetical protein
MRTGGCQCGAVRYSAAGEPQHHALCHCNDCRASSGAPAIAWMAFAEGDVTVTQGTPAVYAGKAGAQRHFCPTCGTGLLYTNAEMLPGIVEVQSATLDNAASEAPEAQIQCAERLPWMTRLGDLTEFDRFPEG